MKKLHLIFNLAGNGIPLFFAFFFMPILIEKFGMQRFGFISIYWALIGSASLFDFGLSRALTYVVAKNNGVLKGIKNKTILLVGIVTFLGFIAMLVLYFLSNKYFEKNIHINSQLMYELDQSMIWIALAVPLTTLSSALRGILEGKKLFVFVNIIKVISGVASFGCLLFSDIFSPGLIGVAIVLVLLRLLMVIGFLSPILIELVKIKTHEVIYFKELLDVFKIGGWISISNIVSPLLLYADKLILGMILSPVILTAYTTSFELALRMLFVAGAISSVIYPYCVSAKKSELNKIIKQSYCYIFIAYFIPLLSMAFFSYQLISLFINDEIANISRDFVWIICIGILFNALAHIPFAIIQGRGRADLTAKVHMIEAIPYIISLYYASTLYGATGAATVWCVRVIVDCISLIKISQHILRE
jgi:O-antigen/teichoic acid export membrane protein